jgi:hypothetical protein
MKLVCNEPLGQRFTLADMNTDQEIKNVWKLEEVKIHKDRLCDLVIRVPGYRSRGPGSIPDATRFSEK